LADFLRVTCGSAAASPLAIQAWRDLANVKPVA
jgi:hypothetical protein